MDYNQRYYNEDKRKDCDKNENVTNGFCCRTIKETFCFPINWRQDDKDDNYYNKEHNCYEKQKSYCDYDEDFKKPCQNHKDERNQKRCGFCGGWIRF